MKKSLIALAVLAAAGAASAQSNVTLYGRLDLGMSQTKQTNVYTGTVSGDTITFVNNGNTKTTDYFGAQNTYTSSRLGVKGVEDLGGGLKATFNYEFGINPDVVASVGKTRQANLGLEGGFGQLKIGTYDNIFFNQSGAVSPGSWIAGDAVADVLGNGYGEKSQDSLQYTTPDFGGLTAALDVGSKKKTTTPVSGVATTEKRTTTGLGVNYANGPITASVAYGIAKVDNQESLKTLGAYASYNIGFATPFVQLAQVKQADGKDTAYALGSTFSFGAINPFITIGQRKLGDVKAKYFELGTTYDLSKRTSVYAVYGQNKTSNDELISTLQDDGTYKGAQKTSGFGLGLVHKF